MQLSKANKNQTVSCATLKLIKNCIWRAASFDTLCDNIYINLFENDFLRYETKSIKQGIWCDITSFGIGAVQVRE